MAKLKRKMGSPGQTIGSLFAIRDKAHLLHLKTTSYAQHVALNEFYDEFIDHIDKLAEGYQSDGLLEIVIPESNVSDLDPVDFITDAFEEVQMFRNNCSHNWALNIYDDILTLMSGTMYKLKNLK